MTPFILKIKMGLLFLRFWISRNADLLYGQNKMMPQLIV